MASTAPAQPSGERATAVFAGGCFWCVEAVFAELRGVETVTSGYTGGSTASPTYEAVCTGTTGHAEAARITFDPAVISYEELLKVFFSVHDPTTPNRQGNDVGTQYRSAIFFLDEAQKETAERVMAELRTSGAFGAPIVTELAPLTVFYPAEAYHQNYYAGNSGQPYCSSVIGPKLAKFRHLFKDRLKRPENTNR
ncbi:MAG TPA: peptide-methionine (S)-S-oxide reductase MsrA [Candidatus Ozemobacteraceae bacterium]|nr:peptide-methionine (S)-S-oxide reductase MsrA [Candidatus Ozemobacteraceae bacterium]